MRKIHQSEIPDPLVSEGECIEYTAIDGRVFHVLAVLDDKSGSCHECTFYKFKEDRPASLTELYICDCGPRGDHSLCYKGSIQDARRCYCRFIDMDKVMEDL